MNTIKTKSTAIYLSLGAIIIGIFGYFSNTSIYAPPSLEQSIPSHHVNNSLPEVKHNKSLPTPLHQTKTSSKAVAATPIRLNTPFASSLEGTDIDGQLKSDASGNLIIDLEVRDFFDYFLNTVGEVTPEVAFAEIKNIIESSLPASAVEQALKVLDEYLLYKETALELMTQELIPSDQQTKDYQIEMLENTFEQMKSIRRQTMSTEAVTAFFALEEAYGEYTLASIKVQHDDSLSVDEKISMQAFHREKLPEIIQKTEDSVLADAAKHKIVHQAITSSSPEDLKQTLADNNYTEEATSEIIAYQNTQSNFDLRYEQYLSEKQQMSLSGLSEQDKSQQIQRLQENYFKGESEMSQARVRDLSS